MLPSISNFFFIFAYIWSIFLCFVGISSIIYLIILIFCLFSYVSVPLIPSFWSLLFSVSLTVFHILFRADIFSCNFIFFWKLYLPQVVIRNRGGKKEQCLAHIVQSLLGGQRKVSCTPGQIYCLCNLFFFVHQLLPTAVEHPLGRLFLYLQSRPAISKIHISKL